MAVSSEDYRGSESNTEATKQEKRGKRYVPSGGIGLWSAFALFFCVGTSQVCRRFVSWIFL